MSTNPCGGTASLSRFPPLPRFIRINVADDLAWSVPAVRCSTDMGTHVERKASFHAEKHGNAEPMMHELFPMVNDGLDSVTLATETGRRARQPVMPFLIGIETRKQPRQAVGSASSPGALN